MLLPGISTVLHIGEVLTEHVNAYCDFDGFSVTWSLCSNPRRTNAYVRCTPQALRWGCL